MLGVVGIEGASPPIPEELSLLVDEDASNDDCDGAPVVILEASDVVAEAVDVAAGGISSDEMNDDRKAPSSALDADTAEDRETLSALDML